MRRPGDAGSASGAPQRKRTLGDRIAKALDRFFRPVVGGAQLATGPEPVRPARPEWVCDACHQPASRHRFDDSMRGRMYCPDQAEPTSQQPANG